MATLSALVKAIADVQGLDENQVLWIARHLREDGLISQGGRGRGGAQMGPGDAANLLIGVNAPGTAKQAAHQVRTFREMGSRYKKLDEYDASLLSQSTGNFFSALQRNAPFGEAIAAIIVDYCHKIQPVNHISIELSGPTMPLASISIVENVPEHTDYCCLTFKYSQYSENIVDAKHFPDQQKSTIFTEITLGRIGSLLTS